MPNLQASIIAALCGSLARPGNTPVDFITGQPGRLGSELCRPQSMSPPGLVTERHSQGLRMPLLACADDRLAGSMPDDSDAYSPGSIRQVRAQALERALGYRHSRCFASTPASRNRPRCDQGEFLGVRGRLAGEAHRVLRRGLDRSGYDAHRAARRLMSWAVRCLAARFCLLCASGWPWMSVRTTER